MLRRFWKTMLSGFLVIMLIFTSWYHKPLGYGINQLAGQLRIIYQTQPIEAILEDPAFPDSLKTKLLLAQEIRDFAIDSLGVNDSENYKTLFDQKGKPVLWVVVACPPFSLEPYGWDFPFFGTFTYKGFFDRQKAVAEEEALKEQGFDTDINEVSAWSTLGWFRDPILSSMLYQSEGGLANTIIHELTHATLYVKDDVTFNENLATFVGDEGAKLFLQSKYGSDHEKYRSYIDRKMDRIKLSWHILRGAKLLDSLYGSFEAKMPLVKKHQLKEQTIRRIMKDIDTVSFQRPERFDHLCDPGQLPNNTYFAHYKTYRDNLNAFEQEFEENFDRNFSAYLDHLKQKYPSL